MSMNDALKALSNRRDLQRAWIMENAPHVASDQKHLDDGTPERAYWHYGYQSALTDVMELLGTLAQTDEGKT